MGSNLQLKTTTSATTIMIVKRFGAIELKAHLDKPMNKITISKSDVGRQHDDMIGRKVCRNGLLLLPDLVVWLNYRKVYPEIHFSVCEALSIGQKGQPKQDKGAVR
ncbi:hypothetical protein CEXT_55571 [Caerostris extrusa]|uniref:Uncharacterized protein n=1 Tax=Caerostris extrusa TaxID=172846 RepID=A0AAV4NDZ5_CAEEX|nr:hypothetical protein CEXT_55571 [Caerostris extrusa]